MSSPQGVHLLPKRLARLHWALAGAVYLGVALWIMGGVLPTATTDLLLPPPPADGGISTQAFDQDMVLGVVARNVRALLDPSLDLLGAGACYPLARPYTLGEHMFGTSLLAILPYVLSGNPVLSYNLALVGSFWIAALAMYALAFHFTRDALAAFVAGLLFCLAHPRLIDLTHPFVHGDLWTPLVLLFLHRTLARGGWGNALALAIALLLVLSQSPYVILSCGLLVLVYGILLLAKHRRDPLAIARLAGASLVFGIAAALLYLPYLESAREWSLTRARQPILALPTRYGPGGDLFPGFVAIALVASAFVDRVRTRRPCDDGEDPRIALAAAGFLVFWCSVWSLSLGFVSLPSPLLLASQVVAPLRSVRALFAIGMGVSLVTAFLAAYGVKALLGRTPAALRGATVTLISAVVLAEHFHPIAAQRIFGHTMDQLPQRSTPPEEDLALLASIPPGAVADLPTAGRKGFMHNAHALKLSAFHGRPTSACYNSFVPEIVDQVAALTLRLPSPPAVAALSSLGFGSLLIHKHLLQEPHRSVLLSQLGADRTDGALLGETADHALYGLRRVDGKASVLLLAAGRPQPAVDVSGREAVLTMIVKNRGPLTFRHPEPIAPSEVVLRWYAASGRQVFQSRSRVLLPLALGPGDRAALSVRTPLPNEPGRYRVDLVPAAWPGVVIARRWVEVRAPVRGGGARRARA